jgi:hypothetical protein
MDVVISAVKSALPKMPRIFTTDRILAESGLPVWRKQQVQTILRMEVEAGRLFRSLAADEDVAGRRPDAWSLDPTATPSAVLRAAVESILDGLPSLWDLPMLLQAVGLSRHMAPRVLAVLDDLERCDRIARTTSTSESKRGRPPKAWTAVPDRIKKERAELESLRRAQAKEDADRRAYFDRVTKPWNPEVKMPALDALLTHQPKKS